MSKGYFLVILILLVFSLQAIMGVRNKSLTYDEIAHIPAGYSYLVTGDLRMNFFHPPLSKIISALPLVFLNLPNPHVFASWNSTDEFRFGREFMQAIGEKQDNIIFLSRIMMVILAVFLGLLVFQWAKDLGDITQGLFALFLFAFEPNIIAHSSLVTPDIGLSFSILFSIFCLWNYVNKPSLKSLIFTGVSLGLVLLSKLTGLILIPIFMVLIYIYRPYKKISYFLFSLLLILFITFFTVWLGYGFETGIILETKDKYTTLNWLISNYPKFLQNGIYFIGRHLVVPCPSFLKGLGWLIFTNLEKYQSFLFGTHFRGSSFLGFLLAFLIKTPIPFLILLVLRLFITIKNKTILNRNEIFLWLVPLVFFIFNAFFAISLQLKYILPIYPFLCIFISQIVNSKFLSITSGRLALLGLSLWYIFGTLNIYPHYLAYFNEFVGGAKNGYKYLVDSNLDWGQDLKLLKQYLEKNNIKEIYLAYFGTAEPDYYKINYKKLEPFKKVSGIIAISATYLQGVHTAKGGYDWLKNYQPIAKIGYSIFVYRIKTKY